MRHVRRETPRVCLILLIASNDDVTTDAGHDGIGRDGDWF